MGLLSSDGVCVKEPLPASREELELFHLPRYLDAIKASQQGRLSVETLNMGLGTGDCPIFSGMYDYLSLAAGGTVTAARLILDGTAEIAFNPSGGFHHAGAGRASGFCYINDVVLGAKILTRAGRRVLFLDVDVHHGDGVQDAFYDTDSVMTISLHQDGSTLFPGTGSVDDIGEGKGRGCSMNIPLPVNTYDDAYRRVYRQVVAPVIRRYAPDVIILELGMDALAGDPLANLRLTNNVYMDIIKDVLDIGKPLLATGGGGYHVENTVRGWALAWQTMCGEDDHASAMPMGGVMLESTEWAGGLRDRAIVVDEQTKARVDQHLDTVTARISSLFDL